MNVAAAVVSACGCPVLRMLMSALCLPLVLCVCFCRHGIVSQLALCVSAHMHMRSSRSLRVCLLVALRLRRLVSRSGCLFILRSSCGPCALHSLQHAPSVCGARDGVVALRACAMFCVSVRRRARGCLRSARSSSCTRRSIVSAHAQRAHACVQAAVGCADSACDCSLASCRTASSFLCNRLCCRFIQFEIHFKPTSFEFELYFKSASLNVLVRRSRSV
jgi:hypothetical protein